MPYSIEQGHPDCEGFAVIKDDGSLIGCHYTKGEADDQLAALYASEADQEDERQVVLVYGPPCAGKSTLVRESSRRGDLVMDRDAIHQALSNLDTHDRDKDISTMVELIWENMLRNIPLFQGNVWIISSAPRRSDRDSLGHLVTRNQLVFVDRETCLQRARDQRPESWLTYIDRWFDNFEPDLEPLNGRSYPMNHERRTVTEGVEIRELEGGGSTAIGYASVFESTSQNLGGFVERVAPGAFKKTLQEADVRALFNHDQNQLLGRVSSGTLRLQEDEKGLRYEVDLPNTQLGRDLTELLRRGDITGSSFGFRTIEDDWSETREGYPLRTLRQVALVDVSPVVYPAYLAAEASLRSLADSRDLDLDEVVKASEANNLKELLEEPGDQEEPSEPHSPGLPLSSFIR